MVFFLFSKWSLKTSLVFHGFKENFCLFTQLVQCIWYNLHMLHTQSITFVPSLSSIKKRGGWLNHTLSVMMFFILDYSRPIKDTWLNHHDSSPPCTFDEYPFTCEIFFYRKQFHLSQQPSSKVNQQMCVCSFYWLCW